VYRSYLVSVGERSRSGNLVRRGDIPLSECLQTFQIAQLHAVAASAGCSLQPHNQDYRGIDWEITHGDALHLSEEKEATVKVQLKATQTVPYPPKSPSFSFRIDNKHLRKLNYTNPTVPRLLLVMLTPSSMADWMTTDQHGIRLHHSAYWVNLSGVQPTGAEKSTVHVPTEQVFDDMALCRIMQRIGAGEKP
jgi:Domain of unknown function (DUF4365)